MNMDQCYNSIMLVINDRKIPQRNKINQVEVCFIWAKWEIHIWTGN